MDVDIIIYLNKIRRFFEDGNLEAIKRSENSSLDIEVVMKHIELMANHNYKESQDPTLTKEQMLEAVTISRLKNPLKEFGPLTGNKTVDKLPMQVISGFEIYLN